MRNVLLALPMVLLTAVAAAQPDQYGWRHDPTRLDPEVRAALLDYCRIKQRQHERNPAVDVPRVCRRYFPGMFFPHRRMP